MNTLVFQENDQPVFHQTHPYQNINISASDYNLLAFKQNAFSICDAEANKLMNDPAPESQTKFEELMYENVTGPFVRAKIENSSAPTIDIDYEVVSSKPLRNKAQTLTLGGRK